MMKMRKDLAGVFGDILWSIFIIATQKTLRKAT